MESQVDYEAVFMASVAPLLVLTPEFVIVAANNSYLEVTGRTRGDLVGRHIFTAFPGNPEASNDPDVEGSEVLRASLARVMATGRPDTMTLQRYDVKATGTPGGFEERYWSSVNAPVLGPDGEVKLIIHRAEEITSFLEQLRRTRGRGRTGARAERKEMETGVYTRARELLDLSERLRQAYKQQGQSVAGLREAIERQRRFVLDASHDLRNPIAGLLTELEVALSESGGGTELQPILHKLLLDAERLNDLVADLLELSRLDTAPPTATEPVDLAHLVVDELEWHTPAADVVTRLDQHVVVWASKIRLVRLLDNLVANAERHTTTKIEIIVSADPPDAVLEVIDDGPGIAPADRDRVFERFCRLDDALRQDPGGSGLGLPIAREIAQAYGGHLSAADHPAGARFVLRLPLAA